jgi:hypothetical protein
MSLVQEPTDPVPVTLKSPNPGYKNISFETTVTLELVGFTVTNK